MERTEFRRRRLPTIFIHTIFIALFIWFYFFFDQFKLIILILIIQLFMFLKDIKNKLVIEGDTIRYEKLFNATEVSVQQITHIFKTERTVYTDRGTSKEYKIHIVGKDVDDIHKEEYTTFFKLPIALIPKQDYDRFENTIKTINPNIDVDLYTNVFTLE